MLPEKLSARSSHRKSFLWFLLSLITATVMVFSQSIQVALADLPPWWEPPDDMPPVEPGEPPSFEPLAGGFDWSVPDRFGRDDNQDRLIDYHYDSATFQYDKAWLYPESWPMNFDGCRTEEDANTGVSNTNTYQWVINGETISGNKCRFTYAKDSPNAGNLGFPALGTYPVDLTVTYGDGVTPQEAFHQDVAVRDILIVSLGDSYASGEGVPDIIQKYHLVWGFPIWEQDAVWQDKRCHRSAHGGPPLAAIAIERRDPKTSVTFISYACSGATLGTELFDDNDLNKSRGVGVLGPYIGQEKPSNFIYYHDAGNWNSYIPSQMGQLKDVLIPPAGKSQRQVDALVVSGGGNDMFFAQLMANCLIWEPCWYLPTMAYKPGGSLYSPYDIVRISLGIVSGRESNSVPVNYDRLATEIATINPAPLNVYLTQYPNLMSAEGGGTCRMLEDILWPNPLFAFEPWETADAVSQGLNGLNGVIFQKAHDLKDQGWVYVDGLTRYNLNDDDPNGAEGLFSGHGYCAFNHYIVRAEESELVQGPLYHRDKNTGTAHPNILGNQAIRDRLLVYMLPRLFPQPPANPPVVDEPIYAIGSLVDEPGVNGWYLGSCEGSACYPKVVMQVVGTAAAGVAGAGVKIDGVDACTVSGVSCRGDGGLSNNDTQYTWNIELSADGIYNFQFNLRDSAGAIATGEAQIKVDLHDPVLAAPGPFTVNEGGTVTLEATVAENDDSLVAYTWDLNNDGKFETYDQKPVFSAESLDGPGSQIIQVQATDLAGRTDTAEATITVQNVAPAPTILDAPTSSQEGTAISLSSSVRDPGTADTFTYAWNVKKNGNAFASSTDANFSFTPDDNGSYVVSLGVTDDDGGVGTPASQTIDVTNVAPVLSNISVTPGTVDEGGSVTLSGSISDPGSADSFGLTVAWGDGSADSTTSPAAGSTSFSVTHTYADDNPTATSSDTYNISMSIKDDDGDAGMGSASVVVNNLPPTVSISTPTVGALYAVNATVSLSASMTDPNTLDTLSCSVNWDDGRTTPGTLTSGVCTASHVFSVPGVYTIQVTGTDDDTGSKTGTVMVVVFDPSAGFVTGGGWIDSPAGAYTLDPSLAGRAQFGFVAKYQKGATIPTGQTQFQFNAGSFYFESSSYNWLVVSGARAQFKGTGSVNGVSGYSFLLTLTDGQVTGGGGVDKLRIKIWDANGVVYDNNLGSSEDLNSANPLAIGGGSIVIHSK